MLTRRRFLGFSGVGMLTLFTDCQHPGFQQLTHGPDLSGEALQPQAQLKYVKDRLLGYPINMNTPP